MVDQYDKTLNNSTRDPANLQNLHVYIDTNFPGCLIMPCGSDKVPKYQHKDGKWTKEKAKKALEECYESGALLLLNTLLKV